MDDAGEEFGAPWEALQSVKDAALLPVRIATSPPLLRTYLRTLLLLLTSALLLGLAVLAYSSFYYAYVPVRGIDVPIYLQYSAHAHEAATSALKHPYGIASIDGLVSRQKYDVDVELRLPRSDVNLAAGNWMVGLDMRGPVTRWGGIKAALVWDEDWEVADDSQHSHSGTSKEGISQTEGHKAEVLARSRRPAILTYRSRMTELAFRAVRLPLYMLGWGSESETVRVRLMDGVLFDKGWRNVPTSLRLELRSRVPLDVYSVRVRFAARLEGLRWAMYTHRVASAGIFIGVFWAVEMGVLLITWALFTFFLAPGVGEKRAVKREGTETPKTESEPSTPMSDTSRTFPTLPSQEPLHYSSPKEERETPSLEDVPVKDEREADDEEDDFLLEEPVPLAATGVFTDSGIGTSLESGAEKKGLSKRKSGRTG